MSLVEIYKASVMEEGGELQAPPQNIKLDTGSRGGKEEAPNEQTGETGKKKTKKKCC